MTQIRVALATSALLCAAIAWAEAPLVKYSYTGPTFTLIEGDVPPWTSESRITGYIIVEKIPPSTTIDFLDPDLEYPFPNVPKIFSFTDGARTITQDNIEDRMFDTRERNRPSMHEVRSFWVRTNEAGDIVAWDLFACQSRAGEHLPVDIRRPGSWSGPDRGAEERFRLHRRG